MQGAQARGCVLLPRDIGQGAWIAAESSAGLVGQVFPNAGDRQLERYVHSRPTSAIAVLTPSRVMWFCPDNSLVFLVFSFVTTTVGVEATLNPR